MTLILLYFTYCIIIFFVLFVDEKYFNIVMKDNYTNYHYLRFFNETYDDLYNYSPNELSNEISNEIYEFD